MTAPDGRAFEGRTVVVSGASSGIGRTVATELAGRGARLVLIGRDRERLEETAANIPDATCALVELDLAELGEIMPAIRKVAAETGRVYGLCHAAGVVQTLPLSASKPESFQSVMQVNYLAGMELARSVTRRDVIEQEGGALLFISSIYSMIGVAGEIAYSGSKGAVVAAARAMAIELARRKIRVNVLSPGMVRTEMTGKAFSKLTSEQVGALEAAHPLGFGGPQDVASAAAFLLSPENGWITATDLVVDGGRSAH